VKLQFSENFTIAERKTVTKKNKYATIEQNPRLTSRFYCCVFPVVQCRLAVSKATMADYTSGPTIRKQLLTVPATRSEHF
jgi:hypothetical protein